MSRETPAPRRRRSSAGPWLLTDSPLGWVSRSQVAELLREADHRLTEADYQADLARYERDRLRSRRSIRVVAELVDTARSGAVLSLPRRLRRAVAPAKGPRVPTPPAPPVERSDAQRAGRDREPEVRAPRRPGATRFSHLRFLHLGAAARFNSLVEHVPIDPERWREQLADHADLLVIETPAGQPDWDPLDGELPALLAAATEAGIPSVRIVAAAVDGSAGHGTPPGDADLELLETADAGVRAGDGRLRPTIDATVFNPVGQYLSAPDPVVSMLGATPSDEALRTLGAFDPPVLLIHPPDIPRVEGYDLRRSIGSPEAVQRSLVRAGVLLDHPGWRGDRTETLRTWTAALACGTPVVAVEPPDGELPPGVVATTAADAVETVHRLTIDIDRRERLGIVGRRWALNGHTRAHALHEILEHLGIPVPAPLRTTVLLATNRPELVGRALASVERQRQPDVDIVLSLHGEGFGDVPDSPLISRVFRVPQAWCLGDVLNQALDAATGDLIAKMDDDDHYGPEHLRDLVNGWTYSGADLVGKKVEYVHLRDRNLTVRRPASRPERDRPHVGGPTMLCAADLLRRYRFLRLPNRVDSTLYERLIADGRRIYGIHNRDLILERGGGSHAWQVEDEAFLEEAVEQREGLAIDLATSDPDTGS